jgi:hypothetical protein
MPWHVAFHIQGDSFFPSKVPFAFTKQHDPNVIGNIGRYRGLPIPYGSASFEVPRSVTYRDRIKYLVHTIEPILPVIRETGATHWYICIGRFYHAQCNEEYSLEELQLMTRLECPLAYSAYEVSEEEEQKLLLEL